VPVAVDGKKMAFEENTDGASDDKILWINAAYPMAANIARAFTEYGWCGSIRGVNSGGIVERLPIHRFETDEGNNAIRSPVERLIDDTMGKQLDDAGFLTLVPKVGSNYAAFFGAQSVQKPRKFEGPMGAAASANAQLTARLPYIFTLSRVAQYLKQICRLMIGQSKTRETLQVELNSWLQNYVIPNVAFASQDDLAAKPFSAASVELVEDPANPGWYFASLKLTPHFQFEGIEISLSLVAVPGNRSESK
jgi:type VI secretion system protein ImpC